jgi:uncharacterized protein YkwD
VQAAAHQLRRRIAFAVAATASVAVFAIAPQGAAASGCANAGADPSAVSIGKLQTATLCLLNEQRRSHGVKALRENDKLDLASIRYAQLMAKRNIFEHGDFVGRIRAAKYLSGARSWRVGENIAWGTGSYATPAGIVKMWMNSSGHRHNILSSSFREIGIGVARGAPRGGVSGGGTYVTDFGTRG